MMMQKIGKTDGQTDNSDFIGSSVGQWSKISNLEKCNSLWEGKIIVNQIVLSKIWFLSQIYTILKYIKKKTEKMRNFLSNYKKWASQVPTILGGVCGVGWRGPVKLERKRSVWYLLLRVCVFFFNCYYQSLISGRETGRWSSSPPKFEIFLILSYFPRS